MSFMKKSAAGLALTASALAASTAFAAGFQLTEQSSLGLGRAYAGAGIVGDDLSAVHYNPAGMTLLPGTQVQAGSVWIDVDAEFSGDNGFDENGRLKGQFIPAGFVTYQVNDKFWLGFGMTVPFGMGTEYDRMWEGNDRGTSSKVYTFDMNPNFAYKVSDFISIGGGISVQYAKARLGMMTDMYGMDALHSKIEADSWDWGYNFGIMISPTDKMRFGLAYRSSIEHNAEGHMKFANGLGDLALLNGMEFGTETTLNTPDTVMLTATWEATPDLRLSGLIRWANWSKLDTLTFDTDVPSIISSKSPELALMLKSKDIDCEWQDTWLFSVGADYRLNDAWTVRGGIAYETSAVDEDETRMAVIPDTDRVWLSLGASYHWSKQLQFDVAATMLKGVGDRDLYHLDGSKIGEYDTLDCYILGAQMQYRF